MIKLMTDLWGDQSVTVRFLVTMAVILFAITKAAEWRYMPRAEASENDRQQLAMIIKNGSTLNDFLGRYEKEQKSGVREKLEDDIEGIQMAQAELAISVEVNGESASTKSYSTRLANKLKKLERELLCLTSDSSVCQ